MYDEFERNVKTSTCHSKARPRIHAINEITDDGACAGVAVSTELVMRYESWIRLWSFRAHLDVAEREVDHRAMMEALMMIDSG